MDIGGAIREVPPWGWAAAGGGALILVVWRSRKGATASQQLVPVSAVGQPNIPATGGTLSGSGGNGSGGMDWSPFTDAMAHEESMFSDMFGQVNTQMAAENQTLSDLTHAISALQAAQATGSGNDQKYMDMINALIARIGTGNSTSVTTGNPATSGGSTGGAGAYTGQTSSAWTTGYNQWVQRTGGTGYDPNYNPGYDPNFPFAVIGPAGQPGYTGGTVRGTPGYIGPSSDPTQPEPGGAYQQSPVAVGQAAGTVMHQGDFGASTIGQSLGHPVAPPPPPSQITDPSAPSNTYWRTSTQPVYSGGRF